MCGSVYADRSTLRLGVTQGVASDFRPACCGEDPMMALAAKVVRLASSRARAYRLEHAARAKIKRLLAEPREIWIEVGAGNKRGTHNWVTIDVTKECDIFWDLRKGLPFPSG